MQLSNLVFTLLFYLGAGTLSSFVLLRPSEVGKKFYTIHGYGSVGLCLLAYFFVKQSLAFSVAVSIFLYAFLGIFYSAVSATRVGLGRILGLLSILVLLQTIFFSLKVGAAVSVWPFGIVFLNAVISVALLGTSMGAMLLGHWYLNQPKMSGDELKRITVAYLAAVIARTVFSSVAIAGHLSLKSEMEIYRYMLSNSDGIFILMRYFWGVLGPLALSYFVWGTVKIRSTQSATGILYVVVVFVLIGEIIGHYLSFSRGLPL